MDKYSLYRVLNRSLEFIGAIPPEVVVKKKPKAQYRDLLAKYMALVMEQEGTSYIRFIALPHDYKYPLPNVVFTEWEVSELSKMEKGILREDYLLDT